MLQSPFIEEPCITNHSVQYINHQTNLFLGLKTFIFYPYAFGDNIVFEISREPHKPGEYYRENKINESDASSKVEDSHHSDSVPVVQTHVPNTIFLESRGLKNIKEGY